MARTISSPLITKAHHSSAQQAGSKGRSKLRSSIASELFQKNSRLLGTTGKPRTTLTFSSRSSGSKSSRTSTRVNTTQYPSRQSRKLQTPESQDEYQGREPDVTSKISRNWCEYFADDEEKDGPDESEIDEGGSDENEEDWIDGPTLIAPYQEEDFETEEDRAIALVEYLQVPMQEKSQAIKQELCDLLIDTIAEIRRTQQKLERGADVDRGKGIITFNDACHQRHVDTSHAHAELKDRMADDQAEINKLFVQLKQAYSRRDKLWEDFGLRIEEITKLQAAALEQLDDNVERTIATLEKKGKALSKKEAGKDKEKLLRGVLGKL